MTIHRFALILCSGLVSISANAQYTIQTIAGGGPLDGTPARDIALGYAPSVAVSASGELYVTGVYLNRVFRVSATGTITVVAGTGASSFAGDGGPARLASLQSPTALALDAQGNIYIAEPAGHRIRKISPDGSIVTLAGNGNRGFSGDGGSALSASLNGPNGVAVDAAGSLYIADTGNNRVRRVSSAGVIVTVAGNGLTGFSGDGGPATSATFTAPKDVAVDAAGNLFINIPIHNRIRKVAPDGIITLVAGNGVLGFSGDGGPATEAALSVNGIAADGAGNLYIADTNNSRIRKVSPNGIITAVASLYFPQAVAADRNGNLYIAESNGRISKISTSGLISTAAGNGTLSYSGDGGPARGAQLDRPFNLARDSAGNIYFADSGNNRVRKVSAAGVITTVAGDGREGYGGDGGPATQASLNYPQGVALDPAGNLHISDNGGRVLKIFPDGTIRKVAGGVTQSLGDGGPAMAASLSSPGSIAFDTDGNLYIVDRGHSRVRKVNTQGIISTVVGNGVHGYSGDGGPATSAALWNPFGIALDRAGNLYIADQTNARIRKVSVDGIITTVVGNGVLGFSGDGGPATSAAVRPSNVAVDSDGSLVITDGENLRVRRVSTSGIITTIAGDGSRGYGGDGVPAMQASFSSPYGIALAPNGKIYISDAFSHRIRVLAPNLSVQPTTLSFTYQIGTGPPFPQTILVSGDAVLTSAFASTGSGVPWLWVSPLSGTTPTAYLASISPSGLAPGTHSGAIVISSADGGQASIPVTLTVTPFCTYSVSPSSFALPAGSSAATLSVTVNSGCPWTAVSNSPWMSVTSGASGSASGTVGFSVEANSGLQRTGSLSIAGQTVTVTQSSTVTSGLRFVPLIPCRILDTRPNSIFGANETRAIQISSSNCNVPASAAAYSLNVTAVPAGPLGYLSMWATGQPKPLVSTLNSHDGRIKANAAIVAAGTGGAVNVFATDLTHVVLDINGYFTPGAGDSFYATPACRKLDTRYYDILGANSTRTINIAGGACNIPSNATAYSLNITAVPINGPLSYLTTWPTGQPQPMVSTLNSSNGTITANAAIVPAGVNGAIDVFLPGIAHLIIDSNGYFAPPGGANERTFYPVAPCRILDTRPNGILAAGETRTIHVPSSSCNIPATAKAYSLNATVVPLGLLAYLTLWPSDMAQPHVSTLNDYDGVITSNAAIIPAAANGAINAFVTNTTHLILDINGYFQ